MRSWRFLYFISGLNVDFVGAQNTAEDPAASRHPADLVLSSYLKFGRLTASDGLSSDQTLNRFDRKTATFTHYRHNSADPYSLSTDNVWHVHEGQQGMLWIGTMGGVNKFERETKTFTHYQHVATDPKSLANDSVSAIHEDRTGTLWIGTMKGLDKFDRQNDRFNHYTTKNGLSAPPRPPTT